VRRKSRSGIWSVTAAALLVAGTLGSAVGGLTASAASTHKSAWQHGQLGVVRYILHGLTVTPPRHKSVRGKVRLPLFNQYGVHTGTAQKASIAFHDGTLVHLNQRTDATLFSPTVTKLKNGEIQEVLVPGTNHTVQTASALGAATGTILDIKVVHNKATFVVLEGALHVKTKHGSVLIKTNQQTTVTGQQKPTPAKHVDASKVTNWANAIPASATPEKNVALDFNGGRVADYSSQSTDIQFTAKHLIDGSVDNGWSTAAGQVANQWVKIGFSQNTPHSIGAVAIDPGATHSHPAANDLKNFQIRVSTTGTDDADFTTVFSGTAAQVHALQRFAFSKPVPARYVELVAVNNYGGTGSIDVAEFEAVAFGEPLTLPVPRLTSSTCPESQDGCIQALLDLINATRAANNLGPLILSLTQTRGTNSCVGAVGHSKAMGKTGGIWNTHQGYSTASFPNDICVHSSAPGENIAFEVTGNELTDLQSIHRDMMQQPHDAATCAGKGNSACNLLAPDFNQVGIGIQQANGGTYVTEDFLQ
jgi:mannose-6-phosphate isomerase-like protein (cupin superfamily)